jgi:hypothetical protein
MLRFSSSWRELLLCSGTGVELAYLPPIGWRSAAELPGRTLIGCLVAGR